MTCLGCNRIESHPVTLHDGTVVCNECPSYLAECEARECISMNPEQWEAYYPRMLKARGTQAAKELVELIRRVGVTA